MAPPFGSPGLQNCIEKWAKLRRPPPPPLCKLGIRLWARNHLILGEKWDEIWVKTFFFFFLVFALRLILGEKWDEIWVKTFFFLLFTWFWAKNGTKFEWRPFFGFFFLVFALHLILGEKWDEIWVKTFFFCSSRDFGRKMGRNLSEDFFLFALHLFWAKNGTKFECGNFKFWSMFFSNFLKFLAPPPFQYPAYATVYQYVINLSFVMLVQLYCI